jgi:cytochrome c55X
MIRQRDPGMRSVVLAILLAAIGSAPARAQQGSAERGARTYDKYCATCHGDDLMNNSGIAFDLRRLKADEFPRFVGSVMQGKKAMPAWAGVLDEDQLEDLWAFIRAHAY